jgi:hypothetical protein
LRERIGEYRREYSKMKSDKSSGNSLLPPGLINRAMSIPVVSGVEEGDERTESHPALHPDELQLLGNPHSPYPYGVDWGAAAFTEASWGASDA